MSLVYNLLIALLLTIIIELFIGFISGLKSKRELVTIFLANLITNPSINFIYYLLYPSKSSILFLIFAEILIVFFEWQIYKMIIDRKSTQLLKISLVCNFTSFSFGVLINLLR